MAINGEITVPPELMTDVERFAVYRCYSDSGQLLYVGETGRVGRRLGDHIQKAWFTQVRGVTFEWYAEELDALNAERRAIHVEHPKYNVIHRNSQTIRPSTSAKRHSRRKGSRRAARSTEETRAAALAVLAEEPGISGAQLAARVGMSERWGQAFKANLARRGAAGPEAESDGN